ncbi:MAPEG family protein [Sphingobium fuliginis]|uniref:MAPEG family protein n=1 Tax=Sphingobium fuliginis ATCC 27551 TaxID=1208342 RepID=A0A5B8CNK1_SPHSA|nr:MAPEG family protein [Sphingobium fuliginis]QDC40265.1 MAPEG family protein [Sphingobium fuliginis ATCC 27551]
MTFDYEQRSIVMQSALAVLLCAVVLGGGYLCIPPELVGVPTPMALEDRLGFALKWDLLILFWLAGSVGAVSQKRFWHPADRHGSAYSEPSPALAVCQANLQNTLEQAVLALSAHLILATVLLERELVLIPLLVMVFLVGRATFAIGYAKNPIARAFGMAVTGAPTGFAYVLAASLIMAGR